MILIINKLHGICNSLVQSWKSTFDSHHILSCITSKSHASSHLLSRALGAISRTMVYLSLSLSCRCPDTRLLANFSRRNFLAVCLMLIGRQTPPLAGRPRTHACLGPLERRANKWLAARPLRAPC